eukprot:scaffold52615_cov74-Cyclotella_meneghiniana.AAC.1
MTKILEVLMTYCLKVAAIQKERLDCTYPFIDVKGDESNSIGAAPGPSPQWAHASYLTRLLRCKI